MNVILCNYYFILVFINIFIFQFLAKKKYPIILQEYFNNVNPKEKNFVNDNSFKL